MDALTGKDDWDNITAELGFWYMKRRNVTHHDYSQSVLHELQIKIVLPQARLFAVKFSFGWSRI